MERLKMSQGKIYLPDEKQHASMMEAAWQEFVKTASDAGYSTLMRGPRSEWYKDLFVAGYCFGHNDCLSIIGGQIELENIFGKIIMS